MRKRIIIIIITITIGITSVFYWKSYNKIRKNTVDNSSFNLSFLEIENYIFTKINNNEALLRIYGINNSNKAVGYFPIVIHYYSQKGKLLGCDKVDLLKNNKVILKPKGRFNIEIHIVYPEDAEKVKVMIDKE